MAAHELSEGAVVDGRYRIERRLGRGGMGTVYEALQIKLQRFVALKVLRPEFAEQELAAKRFEREAKAASAIDHRNVVKILDFGQLESGEFYYTMELLKGRDLAQVLRAEGAMPWSRAGWILLQLVRAFAAVHAQGIVHRDIKPANCFLLDPKAGDEPDFVKLLDFGIANVQEAKGATALTGASDIVGTALYMAPEQALSGHVNARTDIYSFGVMMYELLTGRVPFPGENALAVLAAHQQRLPEPPRNLVPSIPPPIEAIILTALAKDPAQRFASMLDIEVAMIPYVELPAATRPVVPVAVPGSGRASQTDRYGQVSPSPAGSWGYAAPPSEAPLTAATLGRPQPRRRGKAVFGVVAGLLVLGLAGVGGWMWWNGTRSAADEQPNAPDDPAPTPAPEPDAPTPTPEPARTVRAAPPPPERQYDPFADPFGAPSLRDRPLAFRPPEGDTAEAAGGPQGDAELIALLPEEPWTAPVGSLAGRVQGEHGRGLEGAGICAWSSDPRAPLELRRKPKCARTDARGRYRIPEVPPGLYDLSVFAEGHLPQGLEPGQRLVLLPGQERKDIGFTLESGGREVTGKVHDRDGQPIAGARVAAVGAVRALAVADEHGAFGLWLPEGEVGLVAWASGYTDVVVRGPAEAPFDVELRREAVIMGKVIWEDTREGVPGARVRAGAPAGTVDPMVFTDGAGLFSIPALPEGQYRPTVYTDEGYGESEPVALEEGTVSAELVIAVRRVVPDVAEPTPSPEEATPSPEPTPPPVEIPPPPPVVAESDKPVSDAMLRKRLARKIRKCGRHGRVELRAKYILESGALFVPEVVVDGPEAAKVRPCAEALAKSAEFRPRKQPALFPTLVVDLE